jgi:pSer/pThr/pTyr-binding forkhead associated (FHA) protein
VPLRLHPAQGEPIVVEAARTLIGRDKTAEVRLNESSISRKHATLERRGTDWVITDNGSANGTFLDNVQVAEAVLRNGQTLRLGAASFRVEIEATLTPTQTIRPADLDPKTQPGIPKYQTDVTASLPPRAAPVPVAVPAAAAAAAPPAVPYVAPVAPGMTRAQAAEVLGVPSGALPAEVRRQYQRLHNDLQIRMTNTPSPSLKRMYQKNLQELKIACELLAPGASHG